MIEITIGTKTQFITSKLIRGNGNIEKINNSTEGRRQNKTKIIDKIIDN